MRLLTSCRAGAWMFFAASVCVPAALWWYAVWGQNRSRQQYGAAAIDPDAYYLSIALMGPMIALLLSLVTVALGAKVFRAAAHRSIWVRSVELLIQTSPLLVSGWIVATMFAWWY